MTYREALEFLFGLELYGVKLGLDNIARFLRRLDNPHTTLRAIHVAGTNGKGSVCSIFESILLAAGFRVGKYTSPHLYDFRERIHINRQMIAAEYVTEFVGRHADYIRATRTTFFETCTAMAMEYFSREKVDWAVVEVGLGGRLDATALINPELTVITKIALDHTSILGDTLEKIAFEKSGIIKSGVPLVTSASPPALNVITNVARERAVELHHLDRPKMLDICSMDPQRMEFTFRLDSGAPCIYATNLVGAHQAENCGLALLGMEVLGRRSLQVSEAELRQGLKNVFWPARMQFLAGNPDIILDCAHNPDGIRAFVDTVGRLYPGRKFVILLGMLRRPDFPQIFQELRKIARLVILTVAEHERAPEPEALAREALDAGVNHKLVLPQLEAYHYARRLVASGEPLLITGSHYTVGEIMKYEKIPT